MLFFRPISNRIGRHQELTNPRRWQRTMVSELTLGTTSHSSARCKGMFSSFMIKQIRINDAPRDYSVFLARLSRAISGTCPKITHRWPQCEAARPDIELVFTFAGDSRFWDYRNNSPLKYFWLSNKRSDHLCIISGRRGLGIDAVHITNRR